MDTDWLHGLAATQGGLVAVRQGRDWDVAPTTLRTHLDRRGWRQLTSQVWLSPGAPTPTWFRARVAVLHVGPPVALARWSAAALHGLHPPALATQLLVPATRRVPRLAHVEALRTRTWRDEEVVAVDGLPVTRMARTTCDLAAVADLDALRRLVTDARQRRLLHLAELVEQLARAGRIRGRRRLARLLVELDVDRFDSEFERLVAAWLRALGRPVVSQYPLRTPTGVVHLDLALPHARVGIECLGFAFHHERRHLDVDTRRRNAIELTGWRVLGLTWDQFTTDRSAFLATLDRAVATQAAA